MKPMKAVITVLFTIALLFSHPADGNAMKVRSGGSGSDGDFQVSFTPLKTVYKVDERIRFKVKGSTTFYLYLFSLSDDGEGFMLLPNRKQQYHKYQAGREYMVPEKEIEFYADRPGLEEVIMVATTKKLDIDFADYKAAGQFYRAKSSVIDAEIKSLQVRSRKKKARQVIQEVQLVITGKEIAGAGPVSTNGGSAFVACDRQQYQDGDRMKITVGADRPGYIYLWYVDPEGNSEFLTKEKVDGEKFVRITGTAEAPYGEHSLVAVYDARGDLDTDKIRFPALQGKGQGETKGISIDSRPRDFAVYHLTIIE